MYTHLIHDFQGSLKSTTRTASRSVNLSRFARLTSMTNTQTGAQKIHLDIHVDQAAIAHVYALTAAGDAA